MQAAEWARAGAACGSMEPMPVTRWADHTSSCRFKVNSSVAENIGHYCETSSFKKKKC